MSELIKNVWIAANPSFQSLNSKLIRSIARDRVIARWEYYQNQDEGSAIEIALDLLTKYLDSISHPVNLIGHSTGGLLRFLYSCKYPQKVNSLTLLGVGSQIAVNWQTHYYALRNLFSCSQEMILANLVRMIFGFQNSHNTKKFIEILKKDLNTSPSNHSLIKNFTVDPKIIEPPLMVCGSSDDNIIDRNALKGWYGYFKEEDILWECHQGGHFFHYFYPELVSQQILKFWDSNLANKYLSLSSST